MTDSNIDKVKKYPKTVSKSSSKKTLQNLQNFVPKLTTTDTTKHSYIENDQINDEIKGYTHGSFEQQRQTKTKTYLEIKSQIDSYIGMKFEQISLSFLEQIFPQTTITVHPKLYPDPENETKYVVPDAVIKNLSPNFIELFGLEEDEYIVLDFKKSIRAISDKDLLYLDYFPHAKLLLCFLEDYKIDQTWKTNLKDLLFQETYVTKRIPLDRHLERIYIWTAKSDFAKYLSQPIKNNFLTAIDSIAHIYIKDIKQICTEIISELTALNRNSLIADIQKLYNPKDIFTTLKDLLILQTVITYTYISRDTLTEEIGLSIATIDLRLVVLLEQAILRRKEIIGGRGYLYFHQSEEEPSYINALDPLAVKGLNLLIESGYISLSNMSISNFREFLQNLLGITSIQTTLRAYALAHELDPITIKELSSKFEINENLCGYILRSLCTIGVLEAHLLGFYSNSVYYRLKGKGEADFSLLKKKYLSKNIQSLLSLIEKNSDIKFNNHNDIKEKLGENWKQTLELYDIMVKNKDKFNDGFTPDNLLTVLEKSNIFFSYNKIRRLLYVLSKHPFNVIAIKRDNSLLYGKIEQFILIDQNNNVLSSNINSQEQTRFQVEQGAQLLEKITNKSFHELHSLLENYRSTAQIYYLLVSHTKNYPNGYTVENILSLIQRYDITLSRHTLLRYLRPLFGSPLNILIAEREGIGEREIIKNIFLTNQLTSSNNTSQDQKKFQIEQGTQLLEKHINKPLNEIKSLFISTSVTVRLYYILYTHVEDYPYGYTIDDILALLKKYDIIMSRPDFLMYLRPLTNPPLNILTVERLGTKENGSIKKILFLGQSVSSNNNLQEQMKFQIEQGICLLEQKTNKSFSILQTFFRRSTPIVRLYYILVTHAKDYPEGYAIKDILELLQKYDILLTRHTLIMYLRPLFNPPINVLKAEREGTGKSGVVIKKIIL